MTSTHSMVTVDKFRKNPNIHLLGNIQLLIIISVLSAGGVKLTSIKRGIEHRNRDPSNLRTVKVVKKSMVHTDLMAAQLKM